MAAGGTGEGGAAAGWILDFSANSIFNSKIR
jgi:hypothetical protein